jgi:hypothetical protein
MAPMTGRVGPAVKDERRTHLGRVAREGTAMRYRYGFGDDWVCTRCSSRRWYQLIRRSVTRFASPARGPVRPRTAAACGATSGIPKIGAATRALADQELEDRLLYLEEPSE